VVRWLIEENELRLGEEQSRQRDAALLTAREGAYGALPVLRVEAQRREGGGRPRPVLVAAVPIELGLQPAVSLQEIRRVVLGELCFEGFQFSFALDQGLERREHLLLHRTLGPQVEALLGHPDLRPAHELDGTAVRLRVAREDVEQRGLAGTVAADQPDLLASLHRERGPGEDFEIPPVVFDDFPCYKNLHAGEITTLEKRMTSPLSSSEPSAPTCAFMLVILYTRWRSSDPRASIASDRSSE
jgi:hypothetical protein